MVNNSGARLLLCVCFICTAPFLAAQNAGFIMERRIAQRLAWVGDDLTLRYEVVIEKEESEGSFREYVRDFSNESFIMVSLPPGKYRYRIIPHDFLDQPGEGSEWVSIEVLPILMPEIRRITPSVVYLEDDAVHTVTISAMNLFPDTEIFLRRLGGDPVVPVEMNINEEGTEAAILIENSQLIPGDYEIVIRNPGGQETHRSGIAAAYPSSPDAVQSQRPLMFHAGLAWMPLIPFYGDAFGDKPAALPGAAARIGLEFSNAHLISAGMEIAASWYAFDGFQRYENAVRHGINLELNLTAKKPLPIQTMALVFRLGAGLSLLLDERGSTVSDAKPWYTVNTDIGVSFQWLVWKSLYLELGTDFINLLTGKNSAGAFRPWLGAGMQF